MLINKYKLLIAYISKYEKIFFFGIVVAFALEIFNAKYFVSGDGPAHIYNANLLTHFFLGTEGNLADYFELNTFPVPNWTGHFVLAILNLLLPIDLVEKSFLLILFFSFIYSFRFFLKSFNPEAGFYAVVIIPFALSVFVYLGFYNFLIAFVFMFLALGYYVRYHDQFKFKRAFVLFLLLGLIYFSHLSILVFTVGSLFGILGWKKLISTDTFKNKFIQFFRSAFPLFLVVLPTIILVYFYQRHHGGSNYFEYLSKETLGEMIVNLSPLVGHGPLEHFYTHFYLIILVLAVIFIVLSKLFYTKSKFAFQQADILWLLAALLLVAYYIVPDSDAKGGFVSIRILFIFYILIFTRIFLYNFSHRVKLLFTLSILFAFFLQLQIRREGQQSMSHWAHNIVMASEKIKPHSVVLPIYCNSHWQGTNLVLYLGAKKPLVMLMNYEAGQVFFPIKWKTEKPINHTNSIHPDVVCKNYFTQFETMPVLPDYLFFYGYNEIPLPEDCLNNGFSFINSRYKIIDKNAFCTLYEIQQ